MLQLCCFLIYFELIMAWIGMFFRFCQVAGCKHGRCRFIGCGGGG